MFTIAHLNVNTLLIAEQRMQLNKCRFKVKIPYDNISLNEFSCTNNRYVFRRKHYRYVQWMLAIRNPIYSYREKKFI